MSPAKRAADFTLTLLTCDPAWIRAGDEAGIQRIGIDIERRGKWKRQGGLAGARISRHRLEDLALVAARVRRARVFVRLNPLHAGTREEIETALALGATSLMLPQFRSPAEAARFVAWVKGRAEVTLLLETGAAVARLRKIVALAGVDEIMIGLNDLALELRVSGPMELAASDLMRHLSAEIRGAGIRFGFGGVAGRHTRGLPVPPDLLLARQAALKSQSAWLARSFFGPVPQPAGMKADIRRLRDRLRYWLAQPAEITDRAARRLDRVLQRNGP